MNKKIYRAARVRFNVAVNSHYGATGVWRVRMIAEKVSKRTGIPTVALHVNQWRCDKIGTRKPGEFRARPSWKFPVSDGVQFVGQMVEE